MHILIIASWYKKSVEEVHAPFIEEQARMLIRAGFKVGLFHPYFIGGFKDRLKGLQTDIKHFDDNGLQTWYYGECSVVPYFRKIIYAYLCRNAEKVYLEYVKQNGTPDILHAHSVFMGGVVTQYLSEKYNIPYVITEHATDLVIGHKSLALFDRYIIEKTYKSSHKSIFVSLFHQRKMFENFRLKNENTSIVNNVLNPSFKFVPIDNTDLSFIITITGGLLDRKNHLLLFDAMIKLKELNINCKIKVIGGDGGYRSKLIEYIDINNLKDNISLLGVLSREEVYNEICKSHCLVSVSKFETFGLSLIEALGVGRPVIASNTGVAEEIVTNENGVILKTLSVKDLVDAIIFVKENYKNYNLCKISEDCHQKFSEEHIVNQLIVIYKSIEKSKAN